MSKLYCESSSLHRTNFSLFIRDVLRLKMNESAFWSVFTRTLEQRNKSENRRKPSTMAVASRSTAASAVLALDSVREKKPTGFPC